MFYTTDTSVFMLDIKFYSAFLTGETNYGKQLEEMLIGSQLIGSNPRAGYLHVEDSLLCRKCLAADFFYNAFVIK